MNGLGSHGKSGRRSRLAYNGRSGRLVGALVSVGQVGASSLWYVCLFLLCASLSLGLFGFLVEMDVTPKPRVGVLNYVASGRDSCQVSCQARRQVRCQVRRQVIAWHDSCQGLDLRYKIALYLLHNYASRRPIQQVMSPG